MIEKRIFYVVYFDNPDIQRCLDTIRLLCNPKEKRRAHITARGPRERFTKISAITEYTERIKGKVIYIHGIGHFFNNDQNTVFLKCRSEQLRQVWNKPDYVGYNPHITLYDGDSREFASELFNRLSKLNLSFSCIADGLRPIVSTKSTKSQYTLKECEDLRATFDPKFVFRTIGEKLSIDTIDFLDFPTRLTYIEELAMRLPEFGIKPAQTSEVLTQI